MDTGLKKLIADRKRLIQVHKDNDFTDGIRSLLTDLYPDTAHFIYELLQNAEDMHASSVSFKLEDDGLIFEHNGTKRDFNLDDIDAITNIGHNSQKKEDATSIGKFGVGFKAVFAYTMSPEIHSGQYHFRIKDYFVPEFDNIKKVNTKDENGFSWTKFYFPFDHPNKSAKKAVEEVRKGLQKLNGESILFLRWIEEIKYELPNGKTGYVSSKKEDDNIIITRLRKVNTKTDKVEKWLRYQKNVHIVDEHKNKKDLELSVAYLLSKKGENIIPIEGK